MQQLIMLVPACAWEFTVFVSHETGYFLLVKCIYNHRGLYDTVDFRAGGPQIGTTQDKEAYYCNSGDSNQIECRIMAHHWLFLFLTLNKRWYVGQLKGEPIFFYLAHPTSLPSFFFGTMIPQALTIDSEWAQCLALFISLVANCIWLSLCLCSC